MWAEMPIVDQINEDDIIENCADHMRDTRKFKDCMKEVVTEWKYCVEHNLTNLGHNRRAWLGQAAMCKRFGFPEDVTRKAWTLLSEELQDLANKAADDTIYEWKDKQCQSDNLKLPF